MSYGATFIVGYLGAALSITVYLSGLQLVKAILSKQSSDDYALFPYMVMLSSAAVWLKYGLLRENMPLIAVNAIGVCVQSLIVGVFYYYARRRSNLGLQLMLGFILVFPMLSYVRYSPNIYIAMDHFGVYCTFMSIMSYGSPLSAVADVCRTKSSGSMSVSLSVLNTLTAALWAAYGLMVHDSNVTLPNFIGLCLSCVQLLLICIYPSRTVRTPTHTDV